MLLLLAGTSNTAVVTEPHLTASAVPLQEVSVQPGVLQHDAQLNVPPGLQAVVSTVMTFLLPA